ncbi:hypothetical protein GLOTRDRAFT_93528 [Gloeophyllum trabeum ATCC 11539]|uniref:Uncharacterized protein n=1 Tax=Gloeophyllum trabeum (strain ATCC 11539 / FP-39264 / Madison 617) TaxID=670483 RepID=S7RSN0_GLOTA|nr:uncharacterized protein GLOTRDRAFT_93528 [Gloeophyllum trabeum ATCC 11539]EPQ56034.1 hypothetical protein GLOTRDRAFT_93528 [Gloeophyllum trabeum ATCC 11539]
MRLSCPRSHYGFILRHSLFGRNPEPASDTGSIIIFGPDGQASVVSPEDVGGNAPSDSQAGIPQAIQEPQDQTGGAAPQVNTTPAGGPTSEAIPTPVATSVVPESMTTGTYATTSVASHVSSALSESVVPSSGTSVSQAASTSAIISTSSLVSSTPALPLSTSSVVLAIPSSSSTPSAAAFTSASSSNNDSLYIGIALGCIAGSGVIIAFVAWLLRMRSHRRRRRLEAESPYLWQNRDRKDSFLDAGYSSKEDYLGPGYSSAMQEGDYSAYDQHLQPPPGIHLNGDSYPADILDSYSSNNSPLQPSVLSAHDRTPLQVANLMPGDVFLSSDEASRPGTSLAMLQTPSADPFSTPRQPTFNDKPRFLGLKDGGLDVPWAPSRGRMASGNAPPGDLEKGIAEKNEEDSWEPLPYPGEGQGLDTGQPTNVGEDKPTAGTNVEAWTASLRANLASVLNMAGGYLSTNASETQSQDKFTTMPSRSKRRSSQRLPGASLTRESTNRTTTSNLYTLEEVEEGTGVVHIRGVETPKPLTRPLTITKRPESAMVKSRQRAQLCVPPSGTVTRASSVYSTASATSSVFETGSRAPRLPSIPPLSRAISIRTQRGPQDTSREGSASRESIFRKESRQQARPKILTRLTSNCSATSVGSDMSRLSTAQDRLTDEEKMVQQALRDRRKKMMNMGAGRGGPAAFRMTSVRTNSSRRSRSRGRL